MASIKTLDTVNPVEIRVPYNFLGNGITSGDTPGYLVGSIPLGMRGSGGMGSITPGTLLSTIAATYSNMGDSYLGEQYPLMEIHMHGTLTSRGTIQLKTLVFSFLSNLDIVQKHML
jgi:hypothetical protein